jgi:hypothetical protein
LNAASTAPDETQPSAHDGQYITNPPPGPGNSAVEWWWYQALSPPTSDGIVPSFEAIFYQGFAFSRAPTDPSYSFAVSGVFPNGTTYFITVPVSSQPSIETKGEGVSGNWGNLGTFQLSEDRSYLQLNFTADSFGVTGTVTMHRDGTAPHVPCATNDVPPPYFADVGNGKTLNSNETILYDQTGWIITMPRAKGQVDMTINGSQLQFTNAVAYHDHNWAPAALDQFAYTWLTGQGSCGPIDLCYLEVQASGSTRENDILTSILVDNGQYLSSQCYSYGDPPRNNINITLTGQTTDPVTSQQVPTGLNLDYSLEDGRKYSFQLSNGIDNPSQPPYHRWRLSGKGGQVGGPQYDCLLIGDWLNPGLAKYTEGQSIFDEQ